MALCFFSIRGYCRKWVVFWELLSICCSSFCHLMKLQCQKGQTKDGPCQGRSTISQGRLGSVLAGLKEEIQDGSRELQVYLCTEFFWENGRKKKSIYPSTTVLKQKWRESMSVPEFGGSQHTSSGMAAVLWEAHNGSGGRGFSVIYCLPGSSFRDYYYPLKIPF